MRGGGGQGSEGEKVCVGGQGRANDRGVGEGFAPPCPDPPCPALPALTPPCPALPALTPPCPAPPALTPLAMPLYQVLPELAQCHPQWHGPEQGVPGQHP